MDTGQYLDMLAEARPGEEALLPTLMAISQFDLTGKPAVEWRYWKRVLTLGRLLAFRTTEPV